MAAGLLVGATPGVEPAPTPAAASLPVAEAEPVAAEAAPGEPAPAATAAPVAADTTAATTTVTTTQPPVGSGTLPGRGELLMDAVAGARDAAQARQSADERDAAEVSTIADQLRVQAEERAEQARAAGDAEVAAYYDAEAQQQRTAGSSRHVVPAPLDADDPVADPGATCSSSDLLELGPIAMAGPDDPNCALDPWIAGQIEDGLDRVR
ncbi:hypothetical protein PSA01_04530 [Pseudonocardia saturnea]|uniref:Colicin import membrane protein n=1 Tax=Pseudonocardia saturnea TaxID=33909 RepID=A0ABQ0RSV1_9PSEU|nr:hypothetical protein PSA01_04530 [Pseudonocardia saturnea]